MNLVALDLDGTLEDSRADMVAAVRRVRSSFGVPARPDEAVTPHVSRGMAHLYRVCFDDVSPGEVGAVQDRYEADYLEHIADTTSLYDGIAGALAELATVATLAVVTNKPERHARALLDALGIGHRFATVVGGDTTPETKPSPLLLSAAAEQVGWQVGQGAVVMVGDSTGDVRLARAFGAPSVWCAWGYVDAPGEAPDLTARTPAELPQVVSAALRG